MNPVVERENAISEDLLQQINDKKLPIESIADRVKKVPIQDLLCAIDDNSLTKTGKKRLAQLCAGSTVLAEIACRLVEQRSFGTALAREILSDQNWSKFFTIVNESRILDTEKHQEKVQVLGKLLTDKRLIMWCVGILLSKSCVKGLTNLYRDGEEDIRMEALKALEGYDSEVCEGALLTAIEDTSKQVRTEAFRILESKVGAERIATMCLNSISEHRQLRDRAVEVLNAFRKIPLDIPGLKPLLSLFGSVLDDCASKLSIVRTAIGDITQSGIRKASSTISFAWHKVMLRRVSSPEADQAVGLLALTVALAWADGSIGIDERNAIHDLIINYGLSSSEYDRWLVEKPDLSELRNYLVLLTDPREAAEEIAKAINLNVSNETAAIWVRQIEEILAIEGTLI